MRKLSESISGVTSGIGMTQGVMNHYTPIDNIIINTRNIFGALLGLVVSKGEDGISLKIQSSSFTNPEVTRNILYNSTFDGHTYLYTYIINQGLRGLKILDLGSTCIAYFFPNDLAEDPCSNDACCGCREMKESRIIECELATIEELSVNEDQEVELEDRTKEELAEIINNNNKVKGAADFVNKMANVITLPENMYIKATKDIDGHESISLRYKTVKRRPFGGKMDSVTSLMNIYCTGANAVWVDAFLNKGLYDDDVINVINSILQFIGAEETSDEAVWNIPDGNERTTKAAKPDENDIENAQQELNNQDTAGGEENENNIEK